MQEFDASSDQLTHRVDNQPAGPGDWDLWADDRVLRTGLRHWGVETSDIAPLGQKLGAAAMRETARLAQTNTPELLLFDRAGRRLDEVRFDPAYHQLMTLGRAAGYCTVAWDGTAGGHAAHAAMVYLLSQVEPGICCPLTMSNAAVPVLAAAADGVEWAEKLTSRSYDPRVLDIGRKSAVTLGMAMTEKQGGSDVRSTTTTAVAGEDGYRLRGHKWFCSAPMSDGFLTLAQSRGGLTCFLVPRWLPDGSRNAIHLMRLKDKLGNRSNASAEIEYHDAYAVRIGAEGQGVKRIIDMIHHTRLDTAMAPAGLMRAALVEAKWWCQERKVFGKDLIDQPLMRAVLADLTLDWYGALVLGLRVAASFEGQNTNDKHFARVAVALAKYLSNKNCLRVIYEAMECLGGTGYTSESPLEMLYREAPLNSIWEGSGNVICLDILRSLGRNTEGLQVLALELAEAAGADRRFDLAIVAHQDRWPGVPPDSEARWFVERLAILLTAAVLLRTAPAAISDAYIATRVCGERGQTAGAISGVDIDGILAQL